MTSEIPHHSQVELPIDKDFEEFRNDCLSEEGWTEVYKDDDCQVWSMKSSNSIINIVRARTIFKDVDADVLYNVLHDHKYRLGWDDNMLEGYVIELVKNNIEIGYYAAKLPSPVSNRDLCNLRAWKVKPDTREYMIFNYSVKHDSCPPKKGFVRAHSLRTGYYIRKLEGGGCEFIYYSQSDPKGWIPAWLINWYMTKLPPKLIDKLHNVALAYPEWKALNAPDDMPWLDVDES